MDIAVSAAKAHLNDLVRRAEAGEEIVLTRHGQAVADIVPRTRLKKARSIEERRAALTAIMEEARARGLHLGKSGAEMQKEINDDVEASWGLS
jgi:prevent-host-death family protein